MPLNEMHKGKGLVWHVRRDADQMESSAHGKLILILSNLVSKARVFCQTQLILRCHLTLAGVAWCRRKDESLLRR
jgi:hypothetical protein